MLGLQPAWVDFQKHPHPRGVLGGWIIWGVGNLAIWQIQILSDRHIPATFWSRDMRSPSKHTHTHTTHTHIFTRTHARGGERQHSHRTRDFWIVVEWEHLLKLSNSWSMKTLMQHGNMSVHYRQAHYQFIGKNCQHHWCLFTLSNSPLYSKLSKKQGSPEGSILLVYKSTKMRPKASGQIELAKKAKVRWSCVTQLCCLCSWLFFPQMRLYLPPTTRYYSLLLLLSLNCSDFDFFFWIPLCRVQDLKSAINSEMNGILWSESGFDPGTTVPVGNRRCLNQSDVVVLISRCKWASLVHVDSISHACQAYLASPY